MVGAPGSNQKDIEDAQVIGSKEIVKGREATELPDAEPQNGLSLRTKRGAVY
jgi:hypothetical protein